MAPGQLDVSWAAELGVLYRCNRCSFRSDISMTFTNFYWISVIFFALAMVMVTVFIFFEKVRFIIGLNWLITVLIVSIPRTHSA